MTHIVTTLEQDFTNFFSGIGSKVSTVLNKVETGGAAILTTLEADEAAIGNGAAEFATFVDNAINTAKPYVATIPALSNALTLGQEVFDNLIGIVEAISSGANKTPGSEPSV